MKSIINALKDAALVPVARRIINKYLIKYHLQQIVQMNRLQINSEKQEIFVALDLQGEPTSIELTIHYRVLSSTCIEITDVRSSREWITTLVNDIVPAEKKQIPVRAIVTTVLSKLIH